MAPRRMSRKEEDEQEMRETSMWLRQGGREGGDRDLRRDYPESRRRPDAGGVRGCSRCRGAWSRDPVLRGFVSLFLVAACGLASTGTGEENHGGDVKPRRQIPVVDGLPTLGESEWMRNGQILTPGGIPKDSTYWDNRLRLYDNYGNWRFGPDYYDADKKQGNGLSQNGANLLYTHEMSKDIKIVNADTQGNFWSGEVTQGGGWAGTVPGKPWIRQSRPFTCDTNPYGECDGEDESDCRAKGCAKGRKLGKPIITPSGGNYNSTVLVSIEVEGLELQPSKLPSKPILPRTAFQNGVCKAACLGKPSYPTCVNKLMPQNGAYGTSFLGGFMRKDTQGNPCKSPTKLHRKLGNRCRCNLASIFCKPGDTFCQVLKEKCISYVDLPCNGPTDNTTCGPVEQGGVCAKGSWYDTDGCKDDLTPQWPDANYQDEEGVQLVGPECRGVVCTDHTQCVHIYYTVDGTTPTRSSRLYTGPFVLDTTIQVTKTVTQKQPFVFITVKAIAVQEGNLDSDVTTTEQFYIKDFVIDTGSGRLWSWGHNTRGQLGLGDGLYAGDPRFPNEVPGAPGLVLPEFCFDPVTEELNPELGCDPSRWVLTNPQAMLFNSKFVEPPEQSIVAVAAGAYHTVAIDESGKLVAWGWNGYGQLGSPTNMPTYGLPSHPTDNTQRNLPTAAMFVDATAEAARFIHVAAGTFHSGSIDTEGYAYLWGVNFQGQLCSGSVANINYPSRIISMPTDEHGNVIPGARWVQLALGQEHTILLASTGQVYACGSNRVNQLGQARYTPDTGDGALSSCIQEKTPFGCPTKFNVRWDRPVLVLGEDDVPRSNLDIPIKRVVKIAAGAYHNLALTADGHVYAWGDNRMNQLGAGPLVNRGTHCCALRVPFYVFDEYADLQPDGGPGALLPGTREPDFPWPGYKVLDIAAGAHFSLAVVVNVSGVGCTEDGRKTGHKCVTQESWNGITTQDWDIPRNVDLISDHFRIEAFDFSKAVGCSCPGSLHLPGGLAGCDILAFSDTVETSDSICEAPGHNGTIPCHYKQQGECMNNRVCRSKFDCQSSNNDPYCNRIIRTCSTKCPCADRSCPGKVTDDQLPNPGGIAFSTDSQLYKHVKKGNKCGCTPPWESIACKNFRDLRQQGALPDCCMNTLPNAPVPNIRFAKAMWLEFHAQESLFGAAAVFGTCADGDMCTPADVKGCFSHNCQYPDYRTVSGIGTAPDDGHPEKPIGHKQTCLCYRADFCVGGTRAGVACTQDSAPIDCAGAVAGTCSRGGDLFDIGGGGAPIFYGDCECRNATELEWLNERYDANKVLELNETQPYYNTTRLELPPEVLLKITFWNSNPCPYFGQKQWTGPGCRLVKLPFGKLVFGWGDTRAGQLGISLVSAPETLKPPDDQPQNVPRPRGLPSLNKIDIVAVAAGAFHAAIISDPQPHNGTVCNLSVVSDLGKGAPVSLGGNGPEGVIGQPFRCEGRNLYTFGSNNAGEMGVGFVTPNSAVDCVSVGGVRVPCENMGGSLRAVRVNPLFGRNISYITLGYKHTITLLGGCPDSSQDRCGICFGENVDCLGCNGLTNHPSQLDWCGVCAGDNTTCSGCKKQYACESQNGRDDTCKDPDGELIGCSPVESYNPCHQGRFYGTPCCLDARGLPATPENSNPVDKKQGEAPGNGPVPCSHFGAYRWRDIPRAGANFCGLMYDECDVCDGDQSRCVDCMGVPNGKQTEDLCNLCGGLATTCVGCDGKPEPNIKLRAEYDACERCKGDNHTCSLMLLVFNGAPRQASAWHPLATFGAILAFFVAMWRL